MAIKDPAILSRSDFDTAIVRLRLSVSEIAKATGVPRTYLSEFRNGDRQLRPEHLAKLRDFFESKGIEFQEDHAPKPQDSAKIPFPGQSSATTSPHPRVNSATSTRCYFTISDEIPPCVITKTLDMMDENDARLAVLLKGKVERDDGLLGDGDFTEETNEDLQEVFSLLSLNYIYFRMLRGWPALSLKPVTEDPETMLEVISATFGKQLQEAGLLETSTSDDTSGPDGERTGSQGDEAAATTTSGEEA